MDEQRFAIVDEVGAVVNAVVWDGGPGWVPPPGCAALPCPDHVGPGWTRTGDGWTGPPEETPT